MLQKFNNRVTIIEALEKFENGMFLIYGSHVYEYVGVSRHFIRQGEANQVLTLFNVETGGYVAWNLNDPKISTRKILI